MKNILRVLLLTFAISGCSTTSQFEPFKASSLSWQERQTLLAKITDWELNGKIGIRTATESQSASLKWVQHDTLYQIDIRGPLGQGGASISGKPGDVIVDVSGEGQFRGPDPETILYSQLGWDLPISDIFWWIRGLPSPDKDYQHTLEENVLKTLKQSGWDITFLRYNKLTPALPQKLRLTRNGLKITLVINQWQPGAG